MLHLTLLKSSVKSVPEFNLARTVTSVQIYVYI